MDVVGVRFEPSDLPSGFLEHEDDIVYISVVVYSFIVELIFVIQYMFVFNTL